MNTEILRFVDTIHRDRQIDKEIIFTGIEMALLSAAQKKLGSSEGIVVAIDRETGDIEASVDGEPLSPEHLGRIAALSGKQVLYQKIREAERDVIYKEFKPRVGQLMTGTVQSKKLGGVLIISLSNKVEGFLPRSEQSPAETFNEGDRIKVVLKEVNLQPNRVQLLCSRASPELVRRLFELEIPEVSDYVVEVKAIAREGGFRTKIAVTTYDPNVDCVGACVGVKGSRIRNIVDELFGEKIDIVRWNESIEIMIVEALKPAEIASLDLDFENQAAVVYVKPDQQSLAIGRRGQNVRIASKLTGWDLNITPVSDEDLERMRTEGVESITQGLFDERVAALEGAAGEEQSAAILSESPLDKLFAPSQEEEGAGDEPESDGLSEAAEVPGEAAVEDLLAPTPGEDALAAGDGTESANGTEGEPAVPAMAPVGGAVAHVGESPAAPSDAEGGGSPEGEESGLSLEELPGVGKITAERMRKAGLGSPRKVLDEGVDALSSVEGISVAKAERIVAYLEERSESPRI
ncbi:MAG: transcription termination factor NusA [Planctomycetota bacterium]